MKETVLSSFFRFLSFLGILGVLISVVVIAIRGVFTEKEFFVLVCCTGIILIFYLFAVIIEQNEELKKIKDSL